MYTTHAGQQFIFYVVKHEVSLALQKIVFIYVNALQNSYMRATFAKKWHAGWTSTPSRTYAKMLPIPSALRVM